LTVSGTRSLPESVPYVRMAGIRVGSGEASLDIRRNEKTVNLCWRIPPFPLS
jgi:hypothetical protein